MRSVFNGSFNGSTEPLFFMKSYMACCFSVLFCVSFSVLLGVVFCVVWLSCGIDI